MDPELLHLTNSDFSLDEHERRKLHNLSSGEYFRYIAKRASGYLFHKLKPDKLEFYCTGFEPAAFSLIVNLPGGVAKKTISTLDLRINAISALCDANPIPRISSAEKPFDFLSVDNLRIWLFGRGEFFGFVEITKMRGFSLDDRSFVEENVPKLVIFIAEENFSFRMHILLEPFDKPGLSFDEEKFYKTVVRQVILGFGADGSTLRLFEYDQNILAIRAVSGHSSGVVIEPRHPGELVSGKVFESEVADVAALIMHEPSLDRGLIQIPTIERMRFIEAGVTSLVVGKLAVAGGAERTHRFGTLSYFFKRPHLFSRRDIDLFRGFCKRVSDALFISQTFADLHAQTAILEAQSRRMTYVEVTNLLAHDLWHKSFNAWVAGEENLKLLDKYIAADRLRGSPAVLKEIQSAATAAFDAAQEVHSTSSNLQSLQIKPSDDAYKPELFNLLDVVEAVEKTLRPALTRQKISIRKSISNTHQLFGPRLLFEQVIFNLMINSIDAARGRTSTRPMNIDVHSHLQSNNTRLIIRYSDEGPGIDHQHFPNEQAIFDIGKTSKPQGTGTGLPVARQIMGTHFSGNLSLSQRRPPLFTIDVPAGKRS